MDNNNTNKTKFSLTTKIMLGMIAGIAVGLIFNNLPQTTFVNEYIIDGLFTLGGQIFISLMKMLVVPVVLVSLVCGVCNLDDARKLGRVGLKTVILYLITTCVAISLAIIIAGSFGIGKGTNLTQAITFRADNIPSLTETLVNIFPSNPIAAMAEGNMLQIIVFAILLGTSMTLLGMKVRRTINIFNELNLIVMRLVTMLIHAAPYGVFCLLAALFAREGISLIGHLIGYFVTVLFVLLLHVTVSNGILLKIFGRLNPLMFFRKMYSAQMFAFSTSSSNVSIPVVLETVEYKLGVKNSVASFMIPLGATINMDGTAIMQGVATVFIANAYNVNITLSGYLMVIIAATLASIGTAGVPGVGLITLTMVLNQVGLPVEGIGLIIGVDRFLDMVRTAVNVTGDAAVACVVAKWEKAFNEDVYNDPSIEL